ncbi:MAG: hypothetical protein HZA52_05485 [Planctomycetes bacterium]|nr:hypothetical protein [Planctomycetota bacterium]
MPRSHARPPLGVTALVLVIVLGTALALWFYVRGPVESRGEPASPRLEDDAALGGHDLTRRSGAGVARSGG